MADTEAVITHNTRKRLAVGYRHYYDDRPWLPYHSHVPAPWIETNTADGCLASSLEDLACFMRMLLNRGVYQYGRLISERSFAQLYEYVFERETGPSGGDDLFGHGGVMPGYWTRLLGDLNAGTGVIVMINGPGRAHNIARFALRTIRAAANEQPLPKIPELIDRRIVENAESYTGSYESLSSEMQGSFDLVAEDERLYMNDEGAKYPLWKVEEGVFVADHPNFSRLPLRFDLSSGSAYKVRHGSRKYLRRGDDSVQKKRETVDPAPRKQAEGIGALLGHYRSHNPFYTNFRVIEGWSGELVFVDPSGGEQALHRIDDMTWRVEETPETIRFDAIVDGQALRANVSGCAHDRFFTD
jgi:hypothetical protein